MSHDNDLSDDLSFNPFSEENHQQSPSNLPNGFYSSAFFPRLSPTRPTLRHRRSSVTETLHKEEYKRHARTPTDLHISPPSAGLHPLKSALAATNNGLAPHDLGITRPYLTRVINEGVLVDATSSSDVEPPPPSPEQERDVIVHQVSSKDSLAGVSLKYGISLPNLRRANQLWTTDSIHLRDVLYIPVDQASRAREFIPDPKHISITPDIQHSTTNPFDLTSILDSPKLNRMFESAPQSPTATVPIRRIPARQLSFFPPSTRISDSKGECHADSTNPYSSSVGGSRSSPGYNKYSPSSQVNSSLTSILTALPIAASTRDEIITRLSFDSVSSSFSDRSRVNSDEEIGHELDDVVTRNASHTNTDDMDDMDELSMPTPKASKGLSNPLTVRPDKPDSLPTLSSSLPKSSHVRSYSSTSPPRFYVTQANETSIRTSQLEPSPDMRLPNFRSSTVGRSAGSRHSKKIVSSGQISRQTSTGKRNEFIEDNESNFDLGQT